MDLETLQQFVGKVYMKPDTQVPNVIPNITLNLDVIFKWIPYCELDLKC